MGDLKPLKASVVDFSEFPPAAKPANLKVPVNWKQDPHGDRSWRARLHKWDWIWPLLADYHQTKDAISFRKALQVAQDWLTQNPLGQKGLSEFAWSDTAVGFRAEALAYLLRAGVEDDLLNPTTRELLLKSTIEHGERLADDKYYTERHNHGLYQDLSLAILCEQLTKLEECSAWRPHALRRFKENLKSSLEPVSGMHLEHSPGYHFTIIPLTARMAQVTKDAALKEMEVRLRSVAGWLVPPDERHIILGDSPWKKLPDWALSRARQLNGIAPVQESGYGIIKTGDSYLLSFLGHHSAVHKHRDDGTFVWYENKQAIITDTGKYAYRYSDPRRRYAESNRAHNTLVVDDKDPKLGKPYGSGIQAIVESGDWYAIVGLNPQLERFGVQHQRFWLYHPGTWLIVVDQVESEDEHQYDRYFHFWHELEVQLSSNAQVSSKVGDALLRGRDLSPDLKIKAELIRNRKDPLQGVMYPYGTKPRPNDVLKLSAKASRALFAMVFRLGRSGHIGRARVMRKAQDFVVDLGATRLELKSRGRASELLVNGASGNKRSAVY